MNGLTRYLDSKLYPGTERVWDAEHFRGYLDGVLRRDLEVLDLGAGRGAVGLDLRDAVSHVAGVDPDPRVRDNPSLDDARPMEPDGSIPYPDASFDLVVSHDVLEHVERPTRLLEEAYRVLRPGGLFVAKTTNRFHYIALIARATPHRFHEYVNRRRGRPTSDTFRTYYACCDARSVRRSASSVGFAVQDIQFWEGRPEYVRVFPLLYPLGFIYERLVNLFSWLSGLRCVMIFTLRKQAHDG